MNFIKSNLLSFIALLLMIGISAWMYPTLPDQIPTDFTFEGEARGSSPKQLVAVLLPLVFIGIIVAINILARISPQKFSMQNSRRAMDIIVFGSGALLVFLHYAMLSGSFDRFVLFFSYGMALFMIIVGNVFGKTERNFFIGLRLPWTLNSVSNWKVTHRLAGQLMVICGLLLIISNTVYSSLPLTLVFSLAPVIIPAIYSIYYYFQYEKDLEQ